MKNGDEKSLSISIIYVLYNYYIDFIFINLI